MQFLRLFEAANPLDYDAIAVYAYGAVDWSDDEYVVRYLQDIDEYDIEKLDSFDTKDPDFLKWFKRQIENSADDAYREISRHMDGNTLQVYRVITAPRDWTPDSRHPGLYWSWDFKAAEAHWGSFEKSHIKWVMEATVSADEIDWVPTLAMNSLTTYEDEKEIRIKSGVPIKITDYYEDFKGRKR